MSRIPPLIISTLLSSFALTATAAPPRTIIASGQEVSIIRTRIGFSTVLQFDSRPTSAVLGDQDAFKVEYVGNALSIKPLFAKAKTNLFVFTDFDGFNFQLVTVTGESSDYVVRVKRKAKGTALASPYLPGANAAVLTRQKCGARHTDGGFTLSIDSIATPPSRSAFLVDFALSVPLSNDTRSIPMLTPSDVTLSQGDTKIPIQTLYLRRPVPLASRLRMEGTLVVRARAVNDKAPAKLTIRAVSSNGAKTLNVSIPLKIPLSKGAKDEINPGNRG